MTPQEKAKEIIDSIEGILTHSLPSQDEPCLPETIEIALIVVDEILNKPTMWVDKEFQNKNQDIYPPEITKEFWQEIKQEIQKL